VKIYQTTKIHQTQQLNCVQSISVIIKNAKRLTISIQHHPNIVTRNKHQQLRTGWPQFWTKKIQGLFKDFSGTFNQLDQTHSGDVLPSYLMMEVLDII